MISKKMKIQVDYFDLKRQTSLLKQQFMRDIETVIDSTDFCNGEKVYEFENNLSLFLHSQYASCTNSGTSALLLALRAIGIKAGDEIIVPTHTFIATVWAPIYLGAVPVFVDCDPLTGNIDVNDIPRKITSRTKAIIGVHLYGQPFDIESVSKICKQHHLLLIEDCAQAFGAIYKNQYVGTFGEIGCFSFYPSKNLGAFGDSGAIITNKKKYYDSINILKNHGSQSKFNHNCIGYNMRMDSIQAAILNTKLKYVTEWNLKRKEIAQIYNENINNSAIEKIKNINYAENVYHLYVIKTKNRGKLKEYLNQKNIGIGIHYPVCCHLQKVFKFLNYKEGDFPNSEAFANECLSLPMYPELQKSEVEYIIDCINAYSD